MNTYKFKMARKLSAMSILAAASIFGPASMVNAGAAGQDTQDTIVFGGYDAREKAYYPYAGLIYHASGDILADGFLARVAGYDVHYKYDSAATPDRTVDAHATVLEAMVGYQKVNESYTLRGYAGADFESHGMSPNNHFDRNLGSHLGLKVQGEVETDYASRNYVGVIATYGTAVDRYWVRGRVGRDFGGFVVGPEAVVKGDSQYNEHRVGIFLNLRNITPNMFTISVGASNAGDSRGGNSPYTSMEFSRTF